MIKTGIIGGAGYTGGELIRLLLHHPHTDLVFVQSRSQAGRLLTEIHSDLIGETVMTFSGDVKKEVDVLFLCLGHGQSKKFLTENEIDGKVKIIDLSQDFRLSSSPDRPFVYGLPELQREKIAAARYIANPGCFATAIQLTHLPLSARGNLRQPLHISAITGSTGAGKSLSDTTHFSWRHGNISIYKAFEHQHLNEIREVIKQLQDGYVPEIMMLPFRGGFTRGILAAVYTQSDLSGREAGELYETYYQSHPFVTISGQNPDVKQVVNTNKAVLHIIKHGSELLIVSVIDNLLKGASGQAVQNMNLLFGIDETAGLTLKSVAF
jgi:N-acetyl-gamma-glutamyl-phosphate reductase